MSMPLITPHVKDIGFPVRRLLPDAAVRSIGPFVFFDHMGPAHFEAGTTQGDVRQHPHIGLATITYLFEGAMMHRDSLGVVQRIEPGAINLMTAGSGITHSERMPSDIRDAGQTVCGIQMWIALPKDKEQMPPRFDHYAAQDLPIYHNGHVQARVLIGQALGMHSPVIEHSPMLCMAVQIQAGGFFELIPHVAEHAVYWVDGQGQVNHEEVSAHTMAVTTGSASIRVHATTDCRIMIIGGAPVDAYRFLWWNFVSSDKALIEAAKERWSQGQFPLVPGETECIPLPG